MNDAIARFLHWYDDSYKTNMTPADHALAQLCRAARPPSPPGETLMREPGYYNEKNERVTDVACGRDVAGLQKQLLDANERLALMVADYENLVDLVEKISRATTALCSQSQGVGSPPHDHVVVRGMGLRDLQHLVVMAMTPKHAGQERRIR